jgi:hypothetical protein
MEIFVYFGSGVQIKLTISKSVLHGWRLSLRCASMSVLKIFSMMCLCSKLQHYGCCKLSFPECKAWTLNQSIHIKDYIIENHVQFWFVFKTGVHKIIGTTKHVTLAFFYGIFITTIRKSWNYEKELCINNLNLRIYLVVIAWLREGIIGLN